MQEDRPGDGWVQALRWHRGVAATVAAADRAGLATAELPAVRAKLLEQSTRLADAAARAGAPAPGLSPTPDEVAAAGPSLGDLSGAAAARLLQTLWETLAAVDRVLTAAAPASLPLATTPVAGAPTAPPAAAAVRPGEPAVPPAPPPPPPSPAPAPAPSPAGNAWTLRDRGIAGSLAASARRSVVLRNVAVYGAYSAGVLAVQIVLFLLLDEERELPASAPLCLIVLPALAWAAGYLTIGALFAPPPGGKHHRTPRLGALVCLVPNALLLCAVGLLFAADLATG